MQNLAPIERICIVGAGSIGGWLGALLSRCANVHLSALARGETLAALQREGLQLHMHGELLRTPVQASADAGQLGKQDLVILAVKAPAVAQVAAQLQPLLGEHGILLSAMNGVPWWFFDQFGGAWQGTRLESVDPGGAIAQAIASRSIVGAVVHASCSTRSPAVVQHHFGQELILGEPSGQLTPRLEALVALFQQAGLQAASSLQIQRDIWYKLWGNMTVNPVSAITGATTDKVMADDLLRGFISSVMLEAREIGARLGLAIAQQPEDRHAVTRKLGAFKTSMLQDVQAGRAVELDALVSSVREIGQRMQLPTPHTDALLGLSRVFMRERGLY